MQVKKIDQTLILSDAILSVNLPIYTLNMPQDVTRRNIIAVNYICHYY